MVLPVPGNDQLAPLLCAKSSVQRFLQCYAIASGTLTYTFVLLSACYCTGHEAELQASDGLNGTWYCTKHTYNGGNIYCLLFGIRI